ncbi:MAG: copper resistance protein CopC [Nocardioides sp.]|nr:copper resistance protein CopC [Nocardioides sp.]
MRVSLVGRAIMACACVVAACCLWAGPANAHSALIGSTPEEGAVLTTAPGSIELEFNENILNIAPAIVLRDDTDTVISRKTPTIDRTVVSTPFPAGLADGSYSIVWRVVSEDGHPVQGLIRFAIGHPSTTTPAEGPAKARGDASSGVPWLAVGIAFAGVLGVAGLLVLRRPTHSTPEPDRRNT